MKTCASCRWWGAEREQDYERPYGSCRALAPSSGPHTINLNKGDPASISLYVPKATWAWSAFDDWCGKYQPKEPNQ